MRAAAVALVLTMGPACAAGGHTNTPANAAAHPTTFPVVALDPAGVHRLGVAGHGREVGVVRGAGGVWLAEPGTPPRSTSLMAENEDKLLPLVAYRRLEADAARPDFGLTIPELVVRVTDAAGQDQAVSVGAPTFSKGGFYASRAGDPHVYLLARRTVDDLRSLVQGEQVNTPRSEEDTKAIAEIDATSDPEEIENPWLAQILQEGQR
jgi:hypothetical protein